VSDGTRAFAQDHGLFWLWRFFYRRKVWVKFRWWSLENWRKGYKFGPVQRFRCCDHTTPHHYPSCWATHSAATTPAPTTEGDGR
jgi:hypothetical protein